MATTSSNLTAGKAMAGQSGNGKFSKRRMAGLVATAALGLTLLAGLAFGPMRPAAHSAASAAAVNLANVDTSGTRIWSGACRAGGSDCLPGGDDTAPALPHARPQGWAGTCRAGGSDCVPEEDFAIPAYSVASPHGWIGTCRAGSSDCIPDEDFMLP
jgi:hypothetical protein